MRPSRPALPALPSRLPCSTVWTGGWPIAATWPAISGAVRPGVDALLVMVLSILAWRTGRQGRGCWRLDSCAMAFPWPGGCDRGLHVRDAKPSPSGNLYRPDRRAESGDRPGIHAPASALLAFVALAALIYSFVDVAWLSRRRRMKQHSLSPGPWRETLRTLRGTPGNWGQTDVRLTSARGRAYPSWSSDSGGRTRRPRSRSARARSPAGHRRLRPPA